MGYPGEPKDLYESGRFRVLRGAMNLLKEPYEMTFNTFTKSAGMEEI